MKTRAFYQGEPGCFSETAALQWRTDLTLMGLTTLEKVFSAVVAPHEDFGIVPFHNIIAGDVPDAARLLAAPSVLKVAEIRLPVEMSLLGVSGATLADIHEVISHPVALDQCRPFLTQLGARAAPVHDTAGAARLVAEGGSVHTAAIAPAEAAAIHGLDVLARAVQSRSDNATTFAVFTRR